jgi:glucokinase
MNLVFGIDAGGTKLAAAVVEPGSGRIIEAHQVPTNRRRGGAAVLSDCVELAAAAAARHEMSAIGIGVPEFVSLDGEVQSAASWDWRDGKWKAAFSAIAPVYLDSDVRAAAIAEARLGAGRGMHSFLYVTIGTGVSHAFVIDGVLWRGARGNAIVTGSPPVETEASGPVLASRAGKVRAEEVLASATDRPLVAAAVSTLGLEIARLVNALDPEAIVIGGGLGLATGFREGIIESMRPQIEADGTRDLAVLAASLGTDAGVIGAALVAERGLLAAEQA